MIKYLFYFVYLHFLLLLDHIRITVHMDISFIILLYTPVSFSALCLLFCVIVFVIFVLCIILSVYMLFCVFCVLCCVL
jgi:hypothetical protein